MPRAPDQHLRLELLESCFRAALDGGSLDLGLDVFARRAGTSARMLVHHFGSREGLERALIARLENELRTTYGALVAAGEPAARSGRGGGSRVRVERAVLSLWDRLTAPATRGLLRLSMEMAHRAGRGDGDARRVMLAEADAWARLLVDGPARLDRDAAEGLVLLVQGAALDFLVTEDPARGQRALLRYLRGSALETRA